MTERVKVNVTIVTATCDKCGYKRKLYFMSDSSYGERILSTKSGEKCVYANLLDEGVTIELKTICMKIFSERNLTIPSLQLGRIISNIYIITCDSIEGEMIDNTPPYRCNNCNNGKMKEDTEFGEEKTDLYIPIVKHNEWNKLNSKCKAELVLEALKTYIKIV